MLHYVCYSYYSHTHQQNKHLSQSLSIPMGKWANGYGKQQQKAMANSSGKQLWQVLQKNSSRMWQVGSLRKVSIPFSHSSDQMRKVRMCVRAKGKVTKPSTCN